MKQANKIRDSTMNKIFIYGYMRLNKVCCYVTPNINLLPAILITWTEYGFIIAFKFLRFHLGFRFEY